MKVAYPPTGAARVAFMIGDPVAQTAMPAGVNEWARDTGRNVLMAPAWVAPDALAGFLEAVRGMRNCDGVVVTAPHKQAALALADATTPAARLVGAANVLFRGPNGSLLGDNVDGAGFVAALEAGGGVREGARAVLFGCGGAGASIAAALVEDGISRLDLVDSDPERARSLAGRLGAAARAIAVPQTVAGYGLVVNATAIGLDGASAVHSLEGLAPDAVVADVVTKPVTTPLLARAAAMGARVQTGRAMALAQIPLLARRLGWAAEERPSAGADSHEPRG